MLLSQSIPLFFAIPPDLLAYRSCYLDSSSQFYLVRTLPDILISMRSRINETRSIVEQITDTILEGSNSHPGQSVPTDTPNLNVSKRIQ